LFAGIGFTLMLAGGGYRPLAKRISERRLLVSGVGLMLGGLTMLAVVAALVTGRGIVAGAGDSLRFGFYAASALTVVGFAFVNPSVSAIISRRTDRDRQGEVLGVNQSFASLGRIVGPLAGMSLFSLHSSRALPYVASVLVLVAVANLMPRITEEAAPPRSA